MMQANNNLNNRNTPSADILTDNLAGESPDVKSVELPDCDLAAKHFVSQTFWELDNKKQNGQGILARGPVKHEIPHTSLQ